MRLVLVLDARELFEEFLHSDLLEAGRDGEHEVVERVEGLVRMLYRERKEIDVGGIASGGAGVGVSESGK